LAAAADSDFNVLRPSRILVVDDNAINCRLIAGMFADSHHELIFGSSGQAAVDKARELAPDLVLLDLRMPGMDGREALVQIRQSRGLELLPVIAVSASSLWTEAQDLGQRFNGYIRKPFSKRELLEELAQFLPQQPKALNGATLPAAPGQPGWPLPPDGPVAPDLVAELRRLVAEVWPAVHDAMAINETRAFARQLEALGRKGRCGPLVQYALTLIHDADNYAVVELEQHLGEFSMVADKLERNVEG
jgi:CheY-like chemotaxis protein